jgi:hypothetical protein
MRKYLSRGAAVAVLGAAVLAVGTTPVHALDSPTADTDTSQDDLKKKGYKCEVVATDFIECTKDGETTYWCSDRGKKCIPKPLVFRPSLRRPALAPTFSAALAPQP